MKIRLSLFNMSDVAWFDHPHGTHVPLPLDASALPDAVVQSLLHALENETGERLSDADGYDLAVARAAIAALAQALGEVG